MDATRNELREEISALRASVRTATARLEAISDLFQYRMLELDTLREAVELLKHESRAAQPPEQQIKSIFDQQRFRGGGSAH